MFYIYILLKIEPLNRYYYFSRLFILSYSLFYKSGYARSTRSIYGIKKAYSILKYIKYIL